MFGMMQPGWVSRLCRRLFAALCLAVHGLAVHGLAGHGAVAGAQPSSGPGADVERCRAIADDTARLRCFEAMTAKPAPHAAPAAPAPPPDIGAWRLVRTANPGGGKDAVAIMHIAEMTKSDLDLAGLTIRCGEHTPEILFVLVRPLPPRTHPIVVIEAGADTTLTATIVPPGAAIALPQEASAALIDAWKNAVALSVRIASAPGDAEAVAIHGVIPLVGLSQAEPLLLANCPAP
jgi:hypothetical protein